MINKQKEGQPIATTNTFSLEKINPLFLGVVIALVTGLCFSLVLKNGFTNWDDNAYVFENPHLAKPIPEAVNYFFGQNYFIGNYIPLTMIVYALEYHVAGMDAGFFHMVQLVIHLANVLLVFWFIYLLSKKKLLVAGFVALFFGIHPMHVESVAWIAELKDVMYTFFFMAGLITYYNYLGNLKGASDQKKSKSSLTFLAATFILFVLSALSKPAALIFPLVLLLLDFYNHRKFSPSTWLEKIPFFIVSFILGYVAILAQKADNLLHLGYSWGERILFASHSFVSYLWKLFLPVGLSNFYPYPETGQGLPVSYYVAPFIIVLLIFGIYKTLKYSRAYAFGFLFFVVNILLVLQFVSVGDAIMADRYTYVSYIGPFYILGILFERYYQRLKLRKLLLAFLLILTCCSFYLTRERAWIWKDDNTLATDLLKKYPNDWLALNNKGFILSEQKHYEEAIPMFKKAIELKPDYTRAYINLINAYMTLNYSQTALKTVNEALSHTPDNVNLLTSKAFILTGQGNNMEAVGVYKQLVALQKNNADAVINLSRCYFALKDYTQALKVLDEGLALYPSNYILLNNKGYVLFTLKKYSEAVPYFKASLALKLDYSTAQINLDDCYRAMNDTLNLKKGVE